MRRTCPRCRVILEEPFKEHMFRHVQMDLTQAAYWACSDLREIGVSEITISAPWTRVELVPRA